MAVVQIAGNPYNAFEDVAAADLYLAADPSRSAAWSVRTDDQKGQGLVSATRLLLAQSSWCITIPDPTDDSTIPQPVHDATAMLAADILTKPALVSNPSGAATNLKMAKAGSVAVEYFGPNPLIVAPPLPSAIWSMLQNAGILGCNAGASSGEDGAYVSGINGCSPFPPQRWIGYRCDPYGNDWGYGRDSY